MPDSQSGRYRTSAERRAKFRSNPYYRLADDTYLLGGARYFHLSNAKAHGSEKNPSYDGVEYYVGLMFAFH
jgi:hypothetical protein